MPRDENTPRGLLEQLAQEQLDMEENTRMRKRMTPRAVSSPRMRSPH